jgi:hypothetical protein
LSWIVQSQGIEAAMIRAVFRQGVIQPLDAVPEAWQEGSELLVQEAAPAGPSPEAVAAWAAEVEAAAARIDETDHDCFMSVLADVEAESKVLGRQQLERSP